MINWAFKVQLACELPVIIYLFMTVRAFSAIGQWSMNLYTANPDTIISPAAIVTLCSIIFALSIADIVIDIYFPHKSKTDRNEVNS
jgi:hypothetical protein